MEYKLIGFFNRTILMKLNFILQFLSSTKMKYCCIKYISVITLVNHQF
jgi:hypothetical protein